MRKSKLPPPRVTCTSHFLLLLVLFTHLNAKHACDVATQLDVDAFKGTRRIVTRYTDLGQAYECSSVHIESTC